MKPRVENPYLKTWEGALEQTARAVSGQPPLPETIPLETVDVPPAPSAHISIGGDKFRSARAMRRVLEKKARQGKLKATITMPDGSKKVIPLGKSGKKT